jgi:hypothetical protein
MIDLILKDARLRPDLFSWWGALSISSIEEWECTYSCHAPKDLRQLWSTKGGGDLFESETILQPFGVPEYDQIEPSSQVLWARGLSSEYCVFHTGLGTSVFRKLDGRIFYIDSEDFSRMSPFQDLDDWYRATVRADFAERYDLAPLS